MYFLNKLFTVPEEVGVEKVWYDDTDPAAEIVAKYLDHDQTLGVDKDLTARFLLPLMERKAATGFVFSVPARDRIHSPGFRLPSPEGNAPVHEK